MPYMSAYSFILGMYRRTLSYLWCDFFSLARLFFWRDFFCLWFFLRLFLSGATLARLFLLARLFFSGATFFLARLFFLWRDFFSLARLFLARLFFSGATFFFWRDFFWRDFFSLARLARLFSLALICRPLLDLLLAQVTNTCS